MWRIARKIPRYVQFTTIILVALAAEAFTADGHGKRPLSVNQRLSPGLFFAGPLQEARVPVIEMEEVPPAPKSAASSDFQLRKLEVPRANFLTLEAASAPWEQRG